MINIEGIKNYRSLVKEKNPNAVIIGFEKVDKRLIDSAPNLKAVFTRTTGLDHIDTDYCLKRGIEVHSLRGENLFDVTSVAELTIGMAIYTLRIFKREELRKSRIHVIGLGRIGTQVAERAKMLGATLSPIEEADIISVHVTADEENRGFLGYKDFVKCNKPILLNPSRPWLIRNLKMSLKKGVLAGAWSDFNMPFKHPNLITTPHLGGQGSHSIINTVEIITKKAELWEK